MLARARISASMAYKSSSNLSIVGDRMMVAIFKLSLNSSPEGYHEVSRG